MKIGLFFGSFNPIHTGHLILANEVLNAAQLDQIWFVVSPQNPFKQKDTLLADYHRLNLVKIAIDDNPTFRAIDIEFKLPKPNYTAITLGHLSETYPTHTFYLIMGEDNLHSLHKWYNAKYIEEHIQIIVYPRDSSISEVNTTAKQVLFLDQMPRLNLSASEIRQKIKSNQSIRYLVTDPVLNYIEEMGFYKQ